MIHHQHGYETKELALCELKIEYAYELSLNSELQIDHEKIEIAQRRKNKIVSYYDNYLYDEYCTTDGEHQEEMMKIFEQDLDSSIDKDYQTILALIREEEFKRLQEQEMKPHDQSKSQLSVEHATRRRSNVHKNQSNILYAVDRSNETNEKQWMKKMKRKQFKICLKKQKHKRLKRKKDEMECKILECQTQIDTKTRLKQLEDLHRRAGEYVLHKIEYVQNVTKEINSLRDTIGKLMTKCT
eukprot:120978_1